MMTRYTTLVPLALCALIACNDALEQEPDNPQTFDGLVEVGTHRTIRAGQNFSGKTSFTYGDLNESDERDGDAPQKITLCKKLVNAHTQAIVEVVDSEGFGSRNCRGRYARTTQWVHVKVVAVVAGAALPHETYIVDVEGFGFGYRPHPGTQYLISARMVEGEWVGTSALYLDTDGPGRRFGRFDPELLEVPTTFDELHRQSTRILSDLATHCPDDIERQYSDEEWALRLYSHEYWGCDPDFLEANGP